MPLLCEQIDLLVVIWDELSDIHSHHYGVCARPDGMFRITLAPIKGEYANENRFKICGDHG